MIQHFSAFPGTVTVESRSGGVGGGAGLNAYFNPAFGFSGSVAWTVGKFSVYEQNGQTVSGIPWHATSGRVHLGIVWFPEV